MSQTTANHWHKMRTDETKRVEKLLRDKGGFQQVDAYRYNSASIRVRVVDSEFEGKSSEDRDAMVEPFLSQLPAKTQADIINLLTLTPEEMENKVSHRKSLVNLEFEDPSRDLL